MREPSASGPWPRLPAAAWWPAERVGALSALFSCLRSPLPLLWSQPGQPGGRWNTPGDPAAALSGQLAISGLGRMAVLPDNP
jgi:hypothetical protein